MELSFYYRRIVDFEFFVAEQFRLSKHIHTQERSLNLIFWQELSSHNILSKKENGKGH